MIFFAYNSCAKFHYRDGADNQESGGSHEDEDDESGFDEENDKGNPTAEENTDGEAIKEPEEKNEIDEEPEDFELIESVVFKGKMIRRQLSVQSHSKSVADLFAGGESHDSNTFSITGSRKVK